MENTLSNMAWSSIIIAIYRESYDSTISTTGIRLLEKDRDDFGVKMYQFYIII